MKPSYGFRMFILEGIFYISFCSLFAYIVSLLLEYGYSEIQCGYATTVQFLVLLIAQPIYGNIIDHGVSPRKVFILLCAGGLIVTPFLPIALSAGFGLSLVAIGLASALDFCAASGAVEPWINTMSHKDPSVNFGMVRSAGSIFYALTALVASAMVKHYNINILFFFHGFGLLLSIMLALRLKDPNQIPDMINSTKTHIQDQPSLLHSLKILFSNHYYRIFLFYGLTYNIASRGVSNYMQVVVNHLNGDIGTLGNSIFIYCVGEFIFMRITASLLRKGLSVETLSIIGLSSLVIRIFLLSIIPSIPWLMATQIFFSIGISSYVQVAVLYPSSLFPPEIRSRSILVFVAITQGIGCCIGNLAGGYIISNLGISIYCLLCSALLALGVLVFVLGKPYRNPRRLCSTDN